MSSMLTQPPDSPDRYEFEAISSFRVWWQRLVLVGTNALQYFWNRVRNDLRRLYQNGAEPLCAPAS